MTTVGRLTFEIDGLRTRLDQQLQQIRQEALKQPLQYKITVDEGASRRSLDAALKALSGKEAKVKLSVDGQAIQAELTRLKALQTVTITVKMAGQADIQNDVATLKALLGTLGTNMQYRVTVNTTALSALNGEINTQIVKLQSLITQLRNLGGRPGPTPPGGGAGGGSISAANRALLAELEALNNQWKRGDIAAADFSRELTALQGKLRTAATAATAGTAEFRALDSGLTRLTMGLRSINTDSFQKIRTDAGAMRAAFDQATAGVERNSAAFSAAQATYSVASAQIIARLQAMQTSGNLTTQQLGQLNRELQRLAREANTINGNINHAGLSGNVVNSFGALGGQFGMIAMQGAAMVAMFRSVAATAGPAAVALTALGGAALMAGGALVGLGAAGLGEVKKLEQGLNILQANGVQDLGAIEDKVKSLQASLGLVGESFSRGDLMLSMADTVKAGVSADAAMTLMASSTRLAAAEQINLNDASGLLLKNIRQYNKDVSEAANVGDMLAKAGNLAAGTANDLSIGLGIVGGTGYQAKIEMYDLLGQLVELDNRGMSAADVGANGLRAALSALSDITKKGQGTLKELGIEFNDAAGKARPAGDIMVDLGAKMRGMGITVDKATGTLSGNGEALRTVSSLMDNRAAAAVISLTGEWKTYGREIRDSEQYLTEYSNTMQQGVAPAMNRVKNAFSEAGGEFVKTFADPLASFLTDTLTPLLKDIGSLFEKLQGMKEIGQIKMSVLFTPGDDATGNILSLLGAPVAAGMAIGQQMNVSELQQALQRGGLIEEPGTPGAALAQRKDIERNYAAWLKLAMENDARIQAGIKNPTGPLAGRTATGATIPLTGEGPLMPGQTRSTDAGGLALVAGLGMAGRPRGAPYGQTYGPNGSWGKHVGEDYFAPVGTAVTAPFSGYVKLRQDAAQGNIVDLFDAAGKRLTMIHLQQYADGLEAAVKKAGGRLLVKEGTVLATVGQTGTSAHAELGAKNAHLHMHATNSAGQIVNPLDQTFQGVTKGAAWTGGAVAAGKTGGAPTAYTGLTAAQIAQAQALNAAIDKAQKALNANPKDTALIKALDSAKEKAKAWGEKSDTNARALQAVTAAQSGLTKATGDYIATQADLAAHGNKALQLIKAQEAANASGNASRILAADNAVKAWAGESKAKAAVLQVERAAYQTRKQAAAEATREAEQSRAEAERKAEQDKAEAERRAKEAQQRAAAINEALRTGKIESARLELSRLETMRENDLRNAGDSALAVATVERRYAELTYNAKKAIAQKEKADRDADIKNDPNLNSTARNQALQNSTRAYTNAVAAAGNERAAAFQRAEDVLDAAAVESAGKLPQAMAGWIGEWAADQAVSRAAATENARVANLIIGGAIDELKKRAAASKAELEEIMTDLYVKALEAGINPGEGGRPDEYRSNEPKTKSGLAALIGDPAGFLAAWEGMGADAALPALMADQYGPEDWRGLSADVLQGLADGMRGKDAWAGIAQIVDSALGDVLEDAALNADVAAMVAARNDQYGAPTPFSTGNERPEDEGSELSRTVGRKRALELYADTLKGMNAVQLDAAENAAIAADNTDHYNAVLAERERRLKADKEAAEAAAKAARELAEAIATTQANAIAQGVKDTADLAAAENALADSQRELNGLMGQSEAPYAAQIRGLEDLKIKMPQLGGEIDALIEKWQQLQKQAQLTDLAGQIASAAQGMGELFDKISGSDAKGALSILGDYMQMNVTAYKQFQSGDVVGAVMTSLNGILNIGESIAELNSGLREWKKNLREVAQEQSKALGMSTGGIKSPWQDALKADMEAQEKLANSKWHQRLAWSIFGGAPQAMKTESAKALAEMQTIFAGFAEGFSGILTNTLTDAFNAGDMSNWAENFSKSFDAQVGQLILKTIIQAAFETGAAANDLGELTKAVKEERYGDIPPILTRLKATAGGIGANIAAIAPSLPGYGAGADDDGTGVPGGSLFGNAPSVQLGIPRFEVSFPEIATRALSDFSAGVPEWRAGVGEFRQAVTEWRAFMAGSGLQTIPARNVL